MKNQSSVERTRICRITVITVFTLVFTTACRGSAEDAPPSSAVTDVVAAGAPVQAAPSGETEASSATAPPSFERKIARNAAMDIRVDNVLSTEKTVATLTEKQGGYIEESRSRTNDAGKHQGEITARVPTQTMRSLLTELAALGQVVSMEETSDDLTDTHIDLTARIGTQKALEQRLLALVAAEGTGLSDLTALEIQLAAVREKIEAAEGKMRALENRISYATVKISIFEPESDRDSWSTRPGPLSFLKNNAADLFWGSVTALLVFLLAGAPWAVLALVIILFVKRARKRKRQAIGKTTAEDERNKTV